MSIKCIPTYKVFTIIPIHGKCSVDLTYYYYHRLIPKERWLDMAKKGGCPLRENMPEGGEKETLEAKEDAKMKRHNLTASLTIG